jgi:hypothetical protein
MKFYCDHFVVALTHLNLVLKLRMRGAVPPLSHTSLRLSVWLSTRTILPFLSWLYEFHFLTAVRLDKPLAYCCSYLIIVIDNAAKSLNVWITALGTVYSARCGISLLFGIRPLFKLCWAIIATSKQTNEQIMPAPLAADTTDSVPWVC